MGLTRWGGLQDKEQAEQADREWVFDLEVFDLEKHRVYCITSLVLKLLAAKQRPARHAPTHPPSLLSQNWPRSGHLV